jgi:hypothetical protein
LGDKREKHLESILVQNISEKLFLGKKIFVLFCWLGLVFITLCLLFFYYFCHSPKKLALVSLFSSLTHYFPDIGHILFLRILYHIPYHGQKSDIISYPISRFKNYRIVYPIEWALVGLSFTRENKLLILLVYRGRACCFRLQNV